MAGNGGPPRGLGTAGRALWRSIQAQIAADELVFDARETAWLELACREADRLADVEKALIGEALVVRGSRGQDVAHPLLAEARGSSLAIAGLLARLKLDDPDAVAKPGRPVAATTASMAARRAALVRHHGRSA